MGSILAKMCPCCLKHELPTADVKNNKCCNGLKCNCCVTIQEVTPPMHDHQREADKILEF
jgi:hypothetical protein